MLMGMRLRAAEHAHANLAGAFAADHECRAAVGHRTAIQELQRQRHRFRGHHVGDGNGVVKLGAGMRQRVAAHQHREFGEVFLRHAIFMHVARRDEPVIGRDGRPQRHLVFGVADLRQRQDRGVAALPGQPVLACDHQHMLDHTGLHQMMRQHGHGEPGGAADLHGVGIGRANAEMLGEHRGQHDVRRDRRVAAEDAVDVAAFQAGIGNRKLGGLAHEVQRGRALVPAECRQSDAGDEAHDLTPLPLAGRGRGWGSASAVPLWHPPP